MSALWSRDRKRIERKRDMKGKQEKDLERRKQRQELIARGFSLKFEARVARDAGRLGKPTMALAEHQRQESSIAGCSSKHPVLSPICRHASSPCGAKESEAAGRDLR